jgi:hypothetical protein
VPLRSRIGGMKSAAATVLVVIACLLVLVGVYAGAYLASVRTISQGSMLYPRYVIGGSSAPAFFRPAHRVDRWLRRDFWGSLD